MRDIGKLFKKKTKKKKTMLSFQLKNENGALSLIFHGTSLREIESAMIMLSTKIISPVPKIIISKSFGKSSLDIL